MRFFSRILTAKMPSSESSCWLPAVGAKAGVKGRAKGGRARAKTTETSGQQVWREQCHG